MHVCFHELRVAFVQILAAMLCVVKISWKLLPEIIFLV